MYDKVIPRNGDDEIDAAFMVQALQRMRSIVIEDEAGQYPEEAWHSVNFNGEEYDINFWRRDKLDDRNKVIGYSIQAAVYPTLPPPPGDKYRTTDTSKFENFPPEYMPNIVYGDSPLMIMRAINILIEESL